MTTIAQSEVESRIKELVQRSAEGETFEIVKDGQPVVRMSPANSTSPKKNPAKARAAAERIIEMAETFGKVPAAEVKAMIHEGHRY